MSSWAGMDAGLGPQVVKNSEECLGTYRGQRSRVIEDANVELSTAEGGYRDKQLFELVQNGADALLEAGGRVQVVLTRSTLYVANEGTPLSSAGLTALMGTHNSVKRGDEIGRFGLGFKSVVAISDSPAIFSRSGSLAFDRDTARTRIEQIVPDAPNYPLLRLAEPLDPDVERAEDPILAELMSWATTVVRVPLKSGYEQLTVSVGTFPPEFLLFLPKAAEVRLEDREKGLGQRMKVVRHRDGRMTLDIDGKASSWRVVSTLHTPSKRALADAGDRARRDAVRVTWAVPLGVRRQLGRLWAFFPTASATTFAGIVNAPWKMSDDRLSLIDGAFNRELLTEVLPALVASSWSQVFDPDNPTAVIDLMPARGKEERSWADDVMNRPIVSALQKIASVPDVQGRLREPRKLRLHPDGLTEELKSIWAAASSHPSDWVHHDVDTTTERRSKVERLFDGVETQQASVVEWVEALVGDPSVEASASAIALLAHMAREQADLFEEARQARVVLLEDGSLARAAGNRVFVRSSPEDDGYAFIHPELALMLDVRADLQSLGVQVLDRAGELRNYLATTPTTSLDWSKVWSLARQCRTDVALTVMKEELGAPLESHVRVRNRKAQFVGVGRAYLPGPIVSDADGVDAEYCIDVAFHRDEIELLEEIGCVPQPKPSSGPPSEPWYMNWTDEAKRSFVEARGKVDISRLVVEGSLLPWPLEPIAGLSGAARSRLTRALLALPLPEDWSVHHTTARSLKPVKVVHPLYYVVQKFGRLDTVFGPASPSLVLAPSDDYPADALPVATDVSSEAMAKLRLLASPEEIPGKMWEELLKRVLSWTDLTRIQTFYAWAGWYAPRPDRMIVQVGRRLGEVKTDDVAVTTSPEVAHDLSEQNIPVLLLSTDSAEADMESILERWNLEDGRRLLEQELVFQASGEPEVVVDRFPGLRLYLDGEQFDTELQFCSAIERVTATRDGLRSRPEIHAIDEGRLLVTATDARQVLQSISDLMQLSLTDQDIRNILDQVRAQQTSELLAKIRASGDDDERLALIAGTDGLRRVVPNGALVAIEEGRGAELDDVELAKLVRAVHGVSALQVFKTAMDEKGLDAPRQWAGRSAARRFVADLGFAPEFAGFAADDRPASFGVDGPVVLGPLHDFQVMVVSGIKKMLRGPAGPHRGMVSLPTGAGKTRVAVQALVEELRDGVIRGQVVWIAQTEELCEQAVETWSYMWRSVGPASRMTVSRLWSSNDAEEVTDGFHLIVATIDKLNLLAGDARYEWMTAPAVVVVDEAHTSIAASYTTVLEWLGRGRSRKDASPLIGLSATPFRGTSEKETERLVRRYDGNRLDEGAFVNDPYTELQARGVLARVKQQSLDGAEVKLTSREAEEIKRTRFLPSTVRDRLAEDRARNRRIVDSVRALPDDWTVLLFATSRENARVLAAMLAFEGVPAVSIDGTTDSRARRHYVEEFKSGRIRVITNYAVFTQGFDAPSVRAVYVTRPTFSPNVYQQMIGRGLRGPLNGGSDEVLIVNVEDNWNQFGSRLAFREFEHLWSSNNPENAGEVDPDDVFEDEERASDDGD